MILIIAYNGNLNYKRFINFTLGNLNDGIIHHYAYL